MLRRILGIVLGGMVIAAVLVLAGCEEATRATPSIEGEWTVAAYPPEEESDPGADYTDEHDITMIFTDDTWVMTFDPPLSSIAVISGSYELLSDSRILMVYEFPFERQVVWEYSVTATTLTLGGIKAKRA